jgi:hypothetical protein
MAVSPHWAYFFFCSLFPHPNQKIYYKLYTVSLKIQNSHVELARKSPKKKEKHQKKDRQQIHNQEDRYWKNVWV